MAPSKIFLDANIIADTIDVSRSNHNQALELLKYLVVNNYEICISENMINTLYYISKDKETTLGFLENVVFVDWTVLAFGKSVLQEAIEVALAKKLDLEDMLQCLCAKENECKILITNDKNFYDCGVSTCKLEEFMKASKDGSL
ncbi:MAG: type II toxin-antitoxin system VapC family toxin [Campylobacteraceae bacterium]|nr:type II toxin-antitoxin system VapC family toxin [Campylobacteraceae bacterium]